MARNELSKILIDDIKDISISLQIEKTTITTCAQKFECNLNFMSQNEIFLGNTNIQEFMKYIQEYKCKDSTGKILSIIKIYENGEIFCTFGKKTKRYCFKLNEKHKDYFCEVLHELGVMKLLKKMIINDYHF